MNADIEELKAKHVEDENMIKDLTGELSCKLYFSGYDFETLNKAHITLLIQINSHVNKY